jgi:hypothetical protein
MVSVIAATGVATLVAMPTPAAADAAPSDSPSDPKMPLGERVPPRDEQFIIAVLVSLRGEAVTDGSALLYVARPTYNRLRADAGARLESDRPGLVLSVISAGAAEAWGIPAGSTLAMAQIRAGVPVPASIVAGDPWFAKGVEVIADPTDPPG